MESIRKSLKIPKQVLIAFFGNNVSTNNQKDLKQYILDLNNVIRVTDTDLNKQQQIKTASVSFKSTKIND